jgi:hypothetical protein
MSESAPWPARSEHAMAVRRWFGTFVKLTFLQLNHNGILLLGGQDSAENAMNDVWFSLTTDSGGKCY